MDWHLSIFELIDMRSFSNLWFWIALAVMWSSASHWVLGVPFDMVVRARRAGGQAETDLEDITRVNVNRMLHIWDLAGPWLMALVSFLLSALAVLGFYYGVEFAQAVFLLGMPMTFVAMLQLVAARRMRAESPQGGDLRKRLTRCRFYTQLIGTVAIFITALWGMYQNLSIGVLGG